MSCTLHTCISFLLPSPDLHHIILISGSLCWMLVHLIITICCMHDFFFQFPVKTFNWCLLFCSYYRRTKSLYGASPNCKFGPKASVMKNQASVLWVLYPHLIALRNPLNVDPKYCALVKVCLSLWDHAKIAAFKYAVGAAIFALNPLGQLFWIPEMSEVGTIWQSLIEEPFNYFSLAEPSKTLAANAWSGTNHLWPCSSSRRSMTSRSFNHLWTSHHGSLRWARSPPAPGCS